MGAGAASSPPAPGPPTGRTAGTPARSMSWRLSRMVASSSVQMLKLTLRSCCVVSVSKEILMVATRLSVWRCPAPPAGPAPRRWPRSWGCVPSTAPLLWTRCSALNKKLEQGLEAASARFCATGHPLEISADLALKNQNIQNYFYTTITVPKDGFILHLLVSKLSARTSPGSMHRDSVWMEVATLVNLKATEACTRYCCPSSCPGSSGSTCHLGKRQGEYWRG